MVGGGGAINNINVLLLLRDKTRRDISRGKDQVNIRVGQGR